ncbi:hypothetical protein AC578_10253 [Pseudocercospora eumusae]|uniref:Uncharacterized protein n=1 Tax=Pseudocercospora eumusae TaxID=321146 RepID=A0A139HZ24_9PEZI|nr:hypothetical protein AC578_10253 [Pseudocercospora eumusae]
MAPLPRKTPKYGRYKKADLAKFARQRHLRVSASKPGKSPHYKDYIRALEAADRDATFRFLDLPPAIDEEEEFVASADTFPELRTLIYNDLLILDNSFTCFPQILRTCKQIKNEATNTLYGHNLIDIRIRPDNIRAHGQLCGDYSPIAADLSLSDPGKIQWLDFLHRAQFIRISLASNVWRNLRTRPATALSERSKRIIIGSIVHSLCEFLAKTHRLRSIQFDFDLLAHNEVQLHQMLYPVRLLGSTVQVPTLGGPPEVPLQQELDIDFLAASPWKRLQVIRKCHSVASRALSIMVGGQGAHFDILLFGALTAADVLKRASRDSYHLRDVLVAIFEKAISRMRGVLNESAPALGEDWRNEALLYEMYQLFRLDIDLKVAKLAL